MKFIAQIVVIASLGYVLEMFLPWWTIAFAAFAGGLFFRTKVNFLSGLIGIGALWFFEIWMIESHGAVPLAEKIAAIFKISKPVLTLVTITLGGLIGAFAALTGALLAPKRRKVYYY